MSRFRRHILIGVFALVTIVLAGASVGRLLGLSADEGAYLTVLLMAVVGWLAGRSARCREEHL